MHMCMVVLDCTHGFVRELVFVFVHVLLCICVYWCGHVQEWASVCAPICGYACRVGAHMCVMCVSGHVNPVICMCACVCVLIAGCV